MASWSTDSAYQRELQVQLGQALDSQSFPQIRNVVVRGVDLDMVIPDDGRFRLMSTGHTPLGYVASIGNLKLVRFLVEMGASLSQMDDYEKTPLEHAIASFDSHAFEVVQFLLEKGVEVTVKVLLESSWSPNSRSSEITRLLLDYVYDPSIIQQAYDESGDSSDDTSLVFREILTEYRDHRMKEWTPEDMAWYPRQFRQEAEAILRAWYHVHHLDNREELETLREDDIRRDLFALPIEMVYEIIGGLAADYHIHLSRK